MVACLRYWSTSNRELWCIYVIEIDSDLYFGVGNEPAASDGAVIARVSPAGVIVQEHSLDEQGCHDIHLHAGKIYVAGTDPTDDWALGNIYIRDTDGNWVKRRTLPLTLHCWGLCHDGNGNLWAGVGAHTGDNATWEGRVMMSDDDGLTWTHNIKLNDYRIYDILWSNGYYYAVGYHWTGSMYEYQLWYSTDGTVWQLIANIYPYRLQRLVAHGVFVVTVNYTLNQLLVIDGISVSSYTLPASYRPVMLNGIVSVDVDLYIVDAAGRIWKTSNFTNWTQYSYIPNAISLGYWPSQQCLVVSDAGVNAKLWKIPLV